MRWRRHRDDGDDRLGRLELAQRDIRALLDEFVDICEQQGVKVQSAARDAVEGVPPGLIAASRTRTSSAEPVLLSLGSRQAIAVTAPGGSPPQWWGEISRRASGDSFRGPAMVRLSHAPLPEGLLALAVPGVTVTVSSSLSPAVRKQAVRTALSAARRAGWMPSRVPAFLLLPLAGLAAAGGKVHAAVASAAALTAATAVAGVLVAVPPAAVRAPSAASRPPGKALTVHEDHRHPVSVARKDTDRKRAGTVVAAGSPRPHPSVQGSGSLAPTTSPSPTQSPAPSASVSVSAGPSSSPPAASSCLVVLGIPVCAGL